MRINNNIMAMNTHRQLGTAQTGGSKSMEKLSSGFRINKAGDDAAGLAISEKMRAQIRGLNQSSRNAQDGISMIQTAEGALSETHNILQRMRELATQSANDTNVAIDRDEIQKEMNQLTSEINRIGNTTEFNTQKLLNGGMESKSNAGVKAATSAQKVLGGDLGSTKAEFTLGNLTDGTVLTATKAITAAVVPAAGDVAIGTWIEVDGKRFTNSEKLTLTAGASAANSALIADAFRDADGNKLSSAATISAAGTIESNTKGALSSVAVQQQAILTGGNVVTTVKGDGVAIVVDGKGFDLSGFETKTANLKQLTETLEKLGNIQAADGTKLSDVVKISTNENYTNTRLTFETISSGKDSSIRFESYSGNTATDSAPLGIIAANHVGATKEKTGEIAEGATKTLSAAATSAKVAVSTAAAMTFTPTANTIAAGTRLTVNGNTFEIGGKDMLAVTTDAAGAAIATTNWNQLKDITSMEDSSIKLSDLVEMTRPGVTATMVLTTKTEGGSNIISISVGNETAFNAGGAATPSQVQGNGTAIKVGSDVFELGGLDIEVATAQDRANTLALLGEVTVKGGTTKLSEVANISFEIDGKLTFEAKAVGPEASIEFMSNLADAALGTVLATDLGIDNKVKGTGAVGAISEGTNITVDNKTFNLGGIEISDPRDTSSVIEALGNATSGGTKLSEMADISVVDGKVSFTAKSTGDTSTISFEGDDGVLGLVASDSGIENQVTGKNTTIERTGLEATNALNTTQNITIAQGSSFRLTLGNESEVTVNLKGNTYKTADSDPKVANAAMQNLVTDINASLQKAGLSGQVSASLSQDNQIQFISEAGTDIKLRDGVNAPLSSALGFSAADMTSVGNIAQVVGPGAQGSGFTANLQIGANQGQSLKIGVDDMRAAALKVTGNAGEQGFTAANSVTNGTDSITSEAALDVSTHESAAAAVTKINNAIEKVSAERSKLGAFQNRLEHTISNLGTSSENLQAAESRIRDVDMAAEMMSFTKNNILSQAATAMLAQANQAPQSVLQLLG